MNPLGIVDGLLEAYESAKKAYEDAHQDQEYLEREYTDLNHALELINFNAVEGYKLAKQMQQNRINRREAKNLKEQLKPLVDLLNKHKSLFSELKNVHAMMEQIVGTQQQRQYRPRERSDLFEGRATE